MPRVTISIIAPNHALDQELLNLDLPPGLTILDLKAFVNAETDFPQDQQQFYLNNAVLQPDSKTLEEAGVKDDDMLVLLTRPPQQQQQQQRQPPQQHQQQNSMGAQQRGSPADIERTRLSILGNANAMAQVREQRPALAEAINDSNRFREVWIEMMREDERREGERMEQMRLLNEDPFNVEAQRKIEEMIRQQSVQDNLQHAYEHNPEVFGRVTMLYINVEVNRHPVKAFVDSGAQTTIMSPSCAEECGIMRLIDKRYSGVARGVGTANIIGRVHSADIKIGAAVMPCSFTVMEGKDVDLLLGLDMLKRFQAVIDLAQNKLIFGHGNEVPFLGEADIPKSLEEAQANEPTVPGPNGTAVGAETGTVKPEPSSSSSKSNFKGQGQTLSPAASSSKAPVAASSAGSSGSKGNFRWDHRGRVAGEDTAVTWFSNDISGNNGLENKNESSYVSEDGGPLQNYQIERNRLQKSPISEGTARNVINSSSDQTISRNVSIKVSIEQVKELAESSTLSCPYPAKLPHSLPSTSLSVSPLQSQSHPLPSSSTPSRWPCHSPGLQLSRQVSDSLILGFKTPSNFYVSEERPVFPSWSNESGTHSQGGSSDNWSRPGFSELTNTSLKESWSFDSESFGFNCERPVRSSSRFSNSPVDLQTCGVCSKLLTEKSSWGTQKIIASNDLSVVSVLICGHVYHAECLESLTSEVNKYDPSCPVCTFGEKYTLKLSEKALKAEMDLKAKNKKSSDIDDSVLYEHFREKGHHGKGPRINSCSSGRKSNGKPFLRRHFSFGSRSTKSMLDNQPTRKKGFFWAKSHKE